MKPGFENKDEERIDMELCRAMYDKDPDRLILLLSEWLEINELKPSEAFVAPEYLKHALFSSKIKQLN